MTNAKTNFAGPNPIVLNVILAIIAFILIIYLKNIYVTIVAVIIVIGVYFVFDTKLLFITSDAQKGPYIETQSPIAVEPTKDPINRNVHVETTNNENAGCSDIDTTNDNIIKISDLDDLEASKSHATDSSKIFVLMNDIDLNGMLISGAYYPDFKASFDGNCYTISNFTIGQGDGNRWQAGFFGSIIPESGSKLYIKNVTFANFSFNVEFNNEERRTGIIAHAMTADTSEEMILLENITVFLQNPSLLTNKLIHDSDSNNYCAFGCLIGISNGVNVLDCNVIISTRIDVLVTQGKTLWFGGLCGWTANSSFMACSVNLIGSTFLMHTQWQPHVGLLCGRSYTSDSNVSKDFYVNLYNNIVIAKDAKIQSNEILSSRYGYLIGSIYNTEVDAKNNSIFLMASQLFDSDILTSGDLSTDVNNKIPDVISVKDMIYGLLLSNGSLETHITKDNPNPDAYWKRTYYVYHEGETSGMNCRFYNVFNFWLNTEDNVYCDTDGYCNTNEYGNCDDNSRRRGWHQIENSLDIQCNSDGTRTYTQVEPIQLGDYFESITLNDGDIFDGGGYSITFSGTNAWNGLFNLIERTYKINVIIKNVTIITFGKISEKKGGILSGSNTNMEYDILIDNCKCSTSSINDYGGGIVGEYFCSNSSCECIIRQCNCDVSDTLEKGAGGICGQYAGSNGKLRIEYCSSNIMTTSNFSGGLLGSMSGSDNSGTYLFIFNSYSKIENELNHKSGGIIAPTSVSGNNTLVLNCYVVIYFPETTLNDKTVIDTTDDSDLWGAIAASSSNGSFKPYMLLCDIYISEFQTDLYIPSDSNTNAMINGEADIDSVFERYISNEGIRSDQKENFSNNEMFSFVSWKNRDIYRKHLEVFNSDNLTNIISNLPYDFIGPIWDIDNISIPEKLNCS